MPVMRYLQSFLVAEASAKAYPERWQSIVEANNQRIRQWLRVNRTHHSPTAGLHCWMSKNEGFHMPITLMLYSWKHPAPVHAPLPGLKDGFTVQDASLRLHDLLLRIFLRLLQRRKFWRSILMSSASLAFTTI